MIKKLPFAIEPSLLAADLSRLSDEVESAVASGVDAMHLDIMDGHFVRNLGFGPQMVAAINRLTDLPLDVHLMIYNPYDYIERFVEAGADSITIHFEATEDVEETLKYIRSCNVRAGLAFNPDTSEVMIPKYLYLCDLILLMTVHPGFGGQGFITEVLDKIRFTREICDRLHIKKGGVVTEGGEGDPFVIQVDGGINLETARLCYAAVANNFVMGTYLFHAPNMAERVAELRDL